MLNTSSGLNSSTSEPLVVAPTDFTPLTNIDKVWWLGASIFDAVIAGRNTLIRRQFAEYGVTGITVTDQSTGGRHVDEILAHWNTVKDSITGQGNVLVACHLLANDAIGSHPYSTMTAATRNQLIADTNTLIDSIVTNGNTPVIVNNTFIDFTSSGDDTYADQDLGVLPFNENINYVHAQNLSPFQWNSTTNRPAINLYPWSYNNNHLTSSDGIHYPNVGSELLRRETVRQLAEFILGNAPVVEELSLAPKSKVATPQDILIMPIQYTDTIPSTQGVGAMYWEFDAASNDAGTVPMVGTDPCSLTITSVGVTGWTYSTDNTQADDGDYAPSLDNFLVRRARISTTNANTYQAMFTIKGGAPNAPFELDLACYELTNSQTNATAFSLDGTNDLVTVNSGSNASSHEDNIGTLTGSFDSNGEFTLYMRRAGGSYASSFSGCKLRILEPVAPEDTIEVISLGASISDGVVAGKTTLMERQFNLHGLDVQVRDESTGGRHLDKILEHWESVKANYAALGQSAKVLMHCIGNDTTSYHPYSSMTAANRTKVQDDLDALVASVIENGNVPILIEASFRGYDENLGENYTWLNEDNGSLPFNKEFINPKSASLVPEQFSVANDSPYIETYNYTFNYGTLLLETNDNRIHFGEEGSELVRRFWIDNTAAMLNGTPLTHIEKMTAAEAVNVERVVQPFIIGQSSTTKTGVNTQLPYANYFQITANVNNVYMLPISGYTPNALTISSTADVLAHGTNSYDINHYNATLDNFLIKRNYGYTTSNVFEDLQTIKGLAPNQICDIGIASYKDSDTQTRSLWVAFNGDETNYISLDSKNDSGTNVVWSEVQADSNGEIVVSVRAAGSAGYWNGMHVIPRPVDQSQNITASITLPAIMAQGNINLGSPDYNAQASITLPGITASANLDHTLPSYVASASITLPAIIAQGNINFGLPDYNAQASIILPGISTSIAVDHTIPGYSASATITTPGITAYIDKSPPAIVFGSIIVLSETLTQPTNYHIH